MLQFWRKTDQNRLISTNSQSNDKKDADNDQIENNCNKAANSSLLVSFEEDRLFELSDYYESIKDQRHSLLPRTLQDVLNNKDVLYYFVKFMESRQASNLINCWLDIDRFESEFNQQQKTIVPKLMIKSDHDSLSISTTTTTDFDSITTDSSSLTEISSDNQQQQQQINECCDRLTGDSNNQDNYHIDDDDDDDESIKMNTLKIFKKYLSQDSNDYINSIDDKSRHELIDNFCNEKYLCFTNTIKQLLFNIIDKEYLQNFLISDYYCKYQINVLTNDQIILDDILSNETILFYFMEYLEQENVRNLLEFWLAATNFQKQQHDQQQFDLIEAQNDAIIIYDKYFSLQAYYPLNLGNKLRQFIEENICNEDGLINLNCFQLPRNIVEYILDKNYLKSFLNSQLFYKYLSELINSTETNSNYLNLKIDQCCNSSGSSEKSFNTTTTTTNSTLFLALEIDNNFNNNSNNNDKNRIKHKSKDMTIDVRELSDPNTLWQRKNINKSLNCRYITNYGKFETDLIPPDRKEYGLKNIMRKFINTMDEQERKKEEMAWQIAEMIVKDVTDITLKQHNT